MYRVPWNVICTPWYCVMYHVIDFLLEKGKKYGIKAEYRFVLWYLFVYLALSCENVKISSSPSAHSIFLHFHTQEPNTQTRIISLTTFCYTISITSYLRSLCLINLPTSMIIVPTWWIMPDRREGIIHHEGTIIIDEGRLSRHKDRKIWCYHYYYHF